MNSIYAIVGIRYSFVSGIITYANYSTPELIDVFLYFIFVSFSIWQGCQWIHLKLRRLQLPDQNPCSRLVLFVCFLVCMAYVFLVFLACYGCAYPAKFSIGMIYSSLFSSQ